MALSVSLIRLIRDEIGADTDITDSELEEIYTDDARGNGSVLVTALICWKRRLMNLQAKSFDVSTSGSLLARSQRIRFIAGQITRLENLVDRTNRGENMAIASGDDSYYASTGSEFSA